MTRERFRLMIAVAVLIFSLSYAADVILPLYKVDFKDGRAYRVNQITGTIEVPYRGGWKRP